MFRVRRKDPYLRVALHFSWAQVGGGEVTACRLRRQALETDVAALALALLLPNKGTLGTFVPT